MDDANLPSIALVQMQVLPGSPARNVEAMLGYIDQARTRGAECVVFPEMCISGYILGDAWEVEALVEDFAAYSDVLRDASQGLTVVFGNVAVDRSRIGEDGRWRKFNAVFVCHDGRYLVRDGVPPGLPQGVHAKTLQPNYRFFDDDRHFYSLRKLAEAQGRDVTDWMLPYEITRSNGEPFRFGVQLCEDIWCQDYVHAGEWLDSLAVFARHGAQTVFNLSASPWTWQKDDKRHRTVSEVLTRSPIPFFYVNQVGAQNNGKNILVFDGDTTAYAGDGSATRCIPAWQAGLAMTEVLPASVPAQSELSAFNQAILSGLRHLDHIRGQENRFLVGASGGIDSSLVLSLLVQAFGPERVFAVNMPSRFNSQATQDNAAGLCDRLAVEYLSCPIEDLHDTLAGRLEATGFSRIDGHYSGLVDENVQARIRGADILAGLAAKHSLVFTNNGNKTEVALGYATLYGDVNGAIAPIADLYKTQVFALARYLNDTIFEAEVIPNNLINGDIVPSAELSAAQDVTKGLGDPIKYGYHDAVLRQLIEYRRHPLDLLRWYQQGRLFAHLQWQDAGAWRSYFVDTDAWIADLEWLYRQMHVNYFKRVQAPPIIVLSKRAFGFDLRESQLPLCMPRAYETLRTELAGSALRDQT